MTSVRHTRRPVAARGNDRGATRTELRRIHVGGMPRENRDHRPGRRAPDTGGTILSAGDHQCPVVIEPNRAHIELMAIEGFERAVLEVPDPYGRRLARCGQKTPIGTEVQIPDELLVPRQADRCRLPTCEGVHRPDHRCPFGHFSHSCRNQTSTRAERGNEREIVGEAFLLPQVTVHQDRPIETSHHDSAAVRIVRGLVHLPITQCHLGDSPPACSLPHTNRSIVAGRNDPLSVWSEYGAGYRLTLTIQEEELFSLDRIPNTGGPVLTRGDNKSTARIERRGVDRATVAYEVGNEPACGRIPYARVRILAGGDNSSAIRIEPRGVDRSVMVQDGTQARHGQSLPQ